MHDWLLILLDKAYDEVNQDLQDPLRSLSNDSLLDFIVMARSAFSALIVHTLLMLYADLVCLIHHYEKMGEVKVVGLVQGRDAVHNLLLDPIH